MKVNYNRATPYKNSSKNSKFIDVSKKTLLFSEYILKHVEGWRLNKRIKSAVSIRSILNASANGMMHHVKGCHDVILHHGTNDLKSANASEKIATNIVELALTIGCTKSKVFISGVNIRNVNTEKEVKDGKKLINFWEKMFG